MCDRWDIGGLSTNFHPQTGVPTIFLYDGHPGGIGIARTAFARFEELCEDAHTSDRRVPLLERLPLLRAVAQVRQPQRAALQGGCTAAAGADARPRRLRRSRERRSERSPAVVEGVRGPRRQAGAASCSTPKIVSTSLKTASYRPAACVALAAACSRPQAPAAQAPPTQCGLDLRRAGRAHRAHALDAAHRSGGPGPRARLGQGRLRRQHA